MENRLSVDGWSYMYSRMRGDAEFRNLFLSGNLDLEDLATNGALTEADIEILREIQINYRNAERRDFEPFDEKLVLCSSSGY